MSRLRPDGWRLCLLALTCVVLSPGAFAAEEYRPRLTLGNLSPSSAGGCLAFSPDGTLLAGGARDMSLELWDAKSFRCIASWPAHKVADRFSAINAVAFHPDGKTLASAGTDDFVNFWNVPTGQATAAINAGQKSVHCIAFTPDGGELASGGLDGTVKVWDVKSGKVTAILKGHELAVNKVAFGPGGQTVVSGSGDGTVRVWHLKTGREVSTFRLGPEEGHYLALSPDGTIAATAGPDKAVKLWDVKTGKLSATLARLQHGVVGLAFSGDGKTLACAGHDHYVMVRDVATGGQVAHVGGHRDPVTAAVSPDGQTLATVSYQNLKVWDVKAGKERPCPKAGHAGDVYSLAFSADGTTLASGSIDSTIKLWDPKTGRETATLGKTEGNAFGLAFSSDGKTLASTCSSLALWDPGRGRLYAVLAPGAEGMDSVAISRDGRLLATGGRDWKVKLHHWGLGVFSSALPGAATPLGEMMDHGEKKKELTPKQVEQLKAAGEGGLALWKWLTGNGTVVLGEHRGRIHAVAFSPDGRTLASASSQDGLVKFWDVATGREKASINTQHQILKMVWSADGKWMATTDNVGTINLWDVAARKEIGLIESHDGGVVSAVAFSPDGKTLATGGDRTVRLWDVEAGKETAAFKAHPAQVMAVAFSRDGKTLAAASGNVVLLWDVPDSQPR